MKKKKVLLIGWDAADWKIINPLMDAGLMPALEKLVNKGAMGNLATLDPPLSPILWTSIATGKTAEKHGILNFVEPDAKTGDIKPVSVTSRKVKAIWNILTQKGYKTHLVGWWPSHPAEPINGVCVSNYFHKILKHEKVFKIKPGTVHPVELESVLEEFHLESHEISAEMLLPFVPDLEKVDQEKDRSLVPLAGIIASAASIQAAATWIMENKEWDFMGVYFDAIDHFCHGYMKYHPPQQNGIPDEYYNLYKNVINSAYRYQDMMLDRMLDLIDEDTYVIVMSDHGFHSDHLRPKKLPNEPIAPALEHSPYGILCISGPDIKKDERIYGATLLDITPTLLTIFGLPIGKDMDGKPLLQVFSKETVPQYIDSWENVPGECGMHGENIKTDPWAEQEALQQLIELGYVEGPGEDKQKRVKHTKNETDFILAKVLSSKKKMAEAIAILEKLYAENPDQSRYGLKLVHCYQTIAAFTKMRQVINEMKERNLPNMPHLDFLEGTLLLAEHRPRKAMECFKKAQEKISHMPDLHISIGNVYNKLKKWKEAESAFLKAIEIDINNPFAYYGLGVSLLRQGEFETAADHLLTAIGLMHHLPVAHYHLGEALYNLQEYEHAAQAFQVAISMNPGYKKAHEWLVELYSTHLHQPEKAAASKKFLEEKIKGTVFIVSGLPRSGTSMMMQMLKEGGMEILTDDSRKPDTDNPKGYFEFEKVKGLSRENSWINDASGKAVKIIAQQLHYLPVNFNYRIIFMERDMTEILKSKQKMRGRDSEEFPAMVSQTFTHQLESSKSWLAGQPNCKVMYVNYKDVLSRPIEISEEISSFLEQDLDAEKMAQAVDLQLYRVKT